MFGIFERLKWLEKAVDKLEQAADCAKGGHDWEWVEGSFSGITARNDYTKGRKCRHCGEFVEYELKIKE